MDVGSGAVRRHTTHLDPLHQQLNMFSTDAAATLQSNPMHECPGSGQAPASGAHALLAALPQPVFVVRLDGRLLLSNPSAGKLLRDKAAEASAGYLVRIGQLDAARLESPLRLAGAGSPSSVGLWFAPRISTGWLHSQPVPEGLASNAGWRGAAVLLVIHLDQAALTQPARIEALARHSRLSATERHVLMLLGDGMTVETAAAHLGVGQSTLRSHVRNLLGKTQASTLMQLLRWTGSAQALPH